jgi:CHAD domain-containing protein
MIVAALPGVATKDVEAVHEMRVAVRRIRSTLRTFRPLFDRARSEWLRTELGWLADVLGAVRDTDVMFARLDDAIANEPAASIIGPVANRIRHQLLATARSAHAELAAALTGVRFRRLSEALAAFIRSRVRPVSAAELRRLAGRQLRQADRLLDAARHSAVDRNEALHEARRACKRARYAIEVLIPIDDEAARTLAKRISDLQEVLGIHQDAVVTANLLRAYAARASSDGENAFSYGLLYGRQLDAGDRALDGLDRAHQRARAAVYF